MDAWARACTQEPAAAATAPAAAAATRPRSTQHRRKREVGREGLTRTQQPEE